MCGVLTTQDYKKKKHISWQTRNFILKFKIKKFKGHYLWAIIVKPWLDLSEDKFRWTVFATA